jgi:tetratricopeptide (TPR) repeat protein
LPGKAVELSNQRLMSVIDRLERRVFELEHTAGKPFPGAATLTVAAESAMTATELDGTAARITVLLGKGQSLLDADKPEEAVACYDEILKLDSNYPEALVKKGAALERLKKDDEALSCYDRAIAADGTLTIAYLYKGGVYNRLERYNEALECYEQALRAQGGAA